MNLDISLIICTHNKYCMKFLIAIVTLLISNFSFAQGGDYLIKNNGDTIWGEIKLNQKVFFIEGKENLSVDAADVKKIKSRRYKGETVIEYKLLTYTDNLADLELDFIQKNDIDTILVLDEIYSTPKINLYYVQDNRKTPFYFYKTPTDEKPVQLVIRYYLGGGLANYDNDRARFRGDRSKVVIQEDKGYVNQLHAIMGDCNKIPQPMWDLLSYRSYSLIKVIKKYNKCN